MSGCAGIPREAYSIFSERMHRKVSDDRVPIVGGLELTIHCNLRCVHCYCGDLKPVGGLDTEEVKDIVDQLADAGTMWLLLTGGEPLLRKDFAEIYLHVKKRGIFPAVFTNATRITPEIARMFAEWRPFGIEVSLYGATRETYEKVTGIEGSYDRCLEGIRMLIEHGVPPALKTMAIRENVHELDQMHELARSMDLHFRFDTQINPTTGGSASPLGQRLDPDQVLELDRYNMERIEAWQEYIGTFSESLPVETLYKCGAGVNAFHIDPYGKLCLCLLARHETYDLRRGSFKEGWNGFIRELRERKASASHKCGSCSLRSICDSCPAWAHLETGSEEGRVDYLCKVAARRAKSFGKPEVQKSGCEILREVESEPAEQSRSVKGGEAR